MRALVLCKANDSLIHAQRQPDADLFFRTFFILHLTTTEGQLEPKQAEITSKGPPHYTQWGKTWSEACFFPEQTQPIPLHRCPLKTNRQGPTTTNSCRNSAGTSLWVIHEIQLFLSHKPALAVLWGRSSVLVSWATDYLGTLELWRGDDLAYFLPCIWDAITFLTI